MADAAAAGSPAPDTSVQATETRTEPSPSAELVLAGADVQHGSFFNRTRMYIKQQTINSTFKNRSVQPDNATLVSHPSQNSAADERNSRGSRNSRLRPTVQVEDYLQSLLPSAGFSSSMELSLPSAGFPAAPTPQLKPQLSDKPKAQPTLGITLPTSGNDVPPPEQCSTPVLKPNPSTDPEDPSTSGPKAKLMATYAYQQITPDGGVALTFDNLEDSADEGALEQLHNAIGTLVEEQNAGGAPTELEQAVAREVQAFSALHDSLRENQEQTRQLVEQLGRLAATELDAEQPDADSSEDTGARSVTPTSGGLPVRPALTTVVETEELTPRTERLSAGEQRNSAVAPVPLPALQPPAQTGPQEQLPSKASDSGQPGVASTSGPPDKPGEKSHKEEDNLTPLRLQKKLASIKEQYRELTATIQLGFQQGRFKRLNIVILVVGTRGDVQPFVGIGLKLQAFGHRVRIASHAVYREFVTGFGLEFYPLGGDPKVLSEFVVKHRGIMPGWNIADALQQRDQVKEILYSTWPACTQPDPKRPDKAFRADAIIANPPAYGHTHCAEALNVPLHVVFTMPWTPTKVFPQPFARIKTSMKSGNSKAREVMNWMSYFAMEDLAWLGMAGMQKDFRQRVLGLSSWNKYTTSHAIYYSQVPITYIWSPALVPRPSDWPQHCEVVGFISVDLKKLTSYDPPAELKDFLDGGSSPVYIGFGSLVVDNPVQLTQQFLAALERTGLRAIIQRGWGGLGAGYGPQPDGKPGKPVPPNVLFIDAAPHDWLFEHVCAVVHHGGAGTTAAGLLAGKPTFIVPFFGDQPFWGAACEQAGVGPAPVPIDDLTTEKIVDALKELILPTRKTAATKLCLQMRLEDGVAAAVDHIHRTIYTTLLGKSTPIWMQNPKNNQQATTSVQELEDEQGTGFLRGILQLPTRIFRGFTTKGSQLNLAQQSTTSPSPAVSLSNGIAASMSSPRQASNLQTVEAVGTEVKRKSFFSFLGC